MYQSAISQTAENEADSLKVDTFGFHEILDSDVEETSVQELMNTSTVTEVNSANATEIMTSEEVMELLQVKRSWLNDHTTRIEPIVPHFRMGREKRFFRSVVMSWLKDRSTSKPTWERE